MKNSHIQWTDHTFNPWEGCTKVSAGCAHCYAEKRNARFGGGFAPNWGPGAPRRRTSAANWKEPVKWNAEAQTALIAHRKEVEEAIDNAFFTMTAPVPPRVFCASLADWLDDEVPIEWLADLLTLIFDCGFLTWQLLTKRPENFHPRLKAAVTVIREQGQGKERAEAIAGWVYSWLTGEPPENVWFGVSAEDQANFDRRVDVLRRIPASIRFISFEPMLGQIKTWDMLNTPNWQLDWAIIGGESGPKARPFQVAFEEDLIAQLHQNGVAVFLKQLGSKPVLQSEEGFEVTYNCEKDGLRAILRHPKGGDPEEWPARLRVQEFPD